MVLLALFASSSVTPRLHNDLSRATLALGTAAAPGAAITGPPRTGKTSFAMQAAVEVALTGSLACFVCSESAFAHKVPTAQTALESLSPDVLGRIDFVYVDGHVAARRELQRLVSEGEPTAASPVVASAEGAPPQPFFVDPDQLPAVVVVDDEGFEDAMDPLQQARTVAALSTTIEWVRAQQGYSAGIAGSRNRCATAPTRSTPEAADADAAVSSSPPSRIDDVPQLAPMEAPGCHSAFYVYVGSTTAASPWPGAPPSGFPLSRVLVHLVTRTDAPLDGDPTCSAHVHVAYPVAGLAMDAPIAGIRYKLPQEHSGRVVRVLE